MTKVEMPAKQQCLRCGHEWVPRLAEIVACPKCRSPYWNRPRRQAPGGKEKTNG